MSSNYTLHTYVEMYNTIYEYTFWWETLLLKFCIIEIKFVLLLRECFHVVKPVTSSLQLFIDQKICNQRMSSTKMSFYHASSFHKFAFDNSEFHGSSYYIQFCNNIQYTISYLDEYTNTRFTGIY